MTANDFENGAGIVVGKKVIAAQLVDYSLQGCCLGFETNIGVKVGDKIRVATSQGQYWGLIRRIDSDKSGFKQLAGIEFVSAIDQSVKGRNSLHFLGADPKHSVGGGFSISFILATLCAWAVVAGVLYWIFNSR